MVKITRSPDKKHPALIDVTKPHKATVKSPSIETPPPSPEVNSAIGEPAIAKPIAEPVIAKPIAKPSIAKPIAKPSITKPIAEPSTQAKVTSVQTMINDITTTSHLIYQAEQILSDLWRNRPLPLTIEQMNDQGYLINFANYQTLHYTCGTILMTYYDSYRHKFECHRPKLTMDLLQIVMYLNRMASLPNVIFHLDHVIEVTNIIIEIVYLINVREKHHPLLDTAKDNFDAIIKKENSGWKTIEWCPNLAPIIDNLSEILKAVNCQAVNRQAVKFLG